MPIVLEMNSNTSEHHRIERSGFVGGGGGHHGMKSLSIYNSPEFGVGDPQDKEEEEDDRSSVSSSSSCCSSIGRNSDDSPAGRSSSDGDGDGDDQEVQSTFTPLGLDSLVALEEVLPIKKSISKFYAGKSKSFTSLADAALITSVEEIVKPEDAYTKKRKNLLAHNNFFGKNRNCIPSAGKGGIYKRPLNSRSSSALAAVMSCCSDSNYSSESLNSSPSSPCFALPPLPPQSRRCSNASSLSPPEQKFSGWRSFSLSDLQAAAAAATPSLAGIKE